MFKSLKDVACVENPGYFDCIANVEGFGCEKNLEHFGCI